MRAGTTHIAKEGFFPAFMAAFQESIIKTNIRGGFRGVGLVPLNPDSVISRLDLKLPAPWVSKTPNNLVEGSLQSKFLKNRISRH